MLGRMWSVMAYALAAGPGFAAAARGAQAAEAPLALQDPAPPGQSAATPWRSPAPPDVRPLPEPADVPEPRPHPGVTFARAPRPLAPGAVTADWNTFLGPTRDAISPETRLLKDFTPGPDGRARPALVWQMVKGEGYASPAIAEGRAIVFHRTRVRESVECLDAERGTAFWSYAYPTAYKDRYGYNGGPRATPTIAGGRVYTYGVEGMLCALDLRTGHCFWRRDLGREFRMRPSFFGAASSPLLEGEKLIVNLGGQGGPSVAAFDAATGRLLWGAETEWGAGYSSPVAATVQGRRVVLVFAGGSSRPPTGGLLALDPETGAVHFRFPWRSPRVASVNASTPVVIGDRVFISSLYDVFGALLRIGPDLQPAEVRKTRQYASHWMTPIVRDGHLYGFAETTLVCMEFQTCRGVWQERPAWPRDAPDADGQTSTARIGRGSLVWADGAFLCLGEYGDLCWMDLAPEGMTIGARAKLFHAAQTWTCPALARGLLYVCQNEPDRATGDPPRVLCYDLRGP